jgi:hypothetical protein
MRRLLAAFREYRQMKVQIESIRAQRQELDALRAELDQRLLQQKHEAEAELAAVARNASVDLKHVENSLREHQDDVISKVDEATKIN